MEEKGFSLVELLAIIVILALVAVISTPIITSVINNSKESAFGSSLEGIKKGIENDYSKRDFEVGSHYIYENSTLYYAEGGSKEVVPMSGSAEGHGYGFVDSNGNVYVAIYNEKYCGTIGVPAGTGKAVKKGISEEECLQPVRDK